MTTNKLTALVKKVEELRQTMKTQGKIALQEDFVEFFGKHPMAKAVVWTQYTPYFNDGDACVFRLNEPELKVYLDKVTDDVAKYLGKDPDEDDEDSDEEDDYRHGDGCALSALTSIADVDCDPRWDTCKRLGVDHRSLLPSEQSLVDDFIALRKNLGSIDEVLETVLGDHCLVRATRDGFEVTEYDHD